MSLVWRVRFDPADPRLGDGMTFVTVKAVLGFLPPSAMPRPIEGWGQHKNGRLFVLHGRTVQGKPDWTPPRPANTCRLESGLGAANSGVTESGS
jgi:hypothetical protein